MAHLHTLLQRRLYGIVHELESTLAARNSDTKSSAGDKHEVGRAMVQQELDKLEEQRAKLIALQQEVDRVPLDRVYDRGAFGSLVSTTSGTYFIAVGLGSIEVDGEAIYAISLASPIGQLLKGKKVGDDVTFGDRTFRLLRIS